jgi:uncharacterized membrane protein
MRTDLVRMVPLWVPNPELMVSFTGLCEICGAVGLLIPATRRVAAVALIALLLAVLPAMAFFIIMQRHIIGGLVAGATKG